MVRGASGCITGGRRSWLKESRRVERWGRWSSPRVLVNLVWEKVTNMFKYFLFLFRACLLCEQFKYVRAGRSVRGDPSLSKEQWVKEREVRDGQGVGEDKWEEAKRLSREMEQ